MRKNSTRLFALTMLALLWSMGNGLSAQVYLNYTVNQPALLSANAGQDQLICPGDPATLGGIPTANGGYGGYVYTWLPSSSLNSSTTANPVATPTVATTYILMLEDAQGCSITDSVTISIDTCVRIDPSAGIHAFEVYPNPNDGKFTVAIDLGMQVEVVRLSVIDLAGRSVFERLLEQPSRTIREEVSLSGLSRGTYFIRMEADGKQLSRKMILR